MKKTVLIASTFIFLVTLTGYSLYVCAGDKSSTGQSAVQSTPNKQAKAQNAAIVNGTPIPMSEYEAALDRHNRQVAMTGKTPNPKDMSASKQVLDSLIAHELLQQEVKKSGIKVDDAEVNAQLETVKKSSSPEDFAKILKQMGITEQEMKDHFASQLAVGKLVEKELGPKVVVTPEEMKAFYDGHPEVFKTPDMIRASHILAKVDKTATPEEKAKALEKIKAAQKRVQGGEDFAAVAKEMSDCPSKANGGDLDFFSKGQMAPAFENAAFSMQPGQTSDIVETEFGYHIIKVTGKKDASTMSFDEVKPKIEQYLKREKMTKEYSQYVEALKSKAKIEVLVQ